MNSENRPNLDRLQIESLKIWFSSGEGTKDSPFETRASVDFTQVLQDSAILATRANEVFFTFQDIVVRTDAGRNLQTFTREGESIPVPAHFESLKQETIDVSTPGSSPTSSKEGPLQKLLGLFGKK